LSDCQAHISSIRRSSIIIVLVLGFLFIGAMSSWGQPKKDTSTLKEGQKLVPYPEKRLGNSIPKENHIVLIGASYARGWNISEIAGLKVINKGVNGNQSFEMLTRFQKDVIAAKPRAVIIWGFINDIFRSRREDIQETLEKIKENYKKMAKMSRDHGITPVIATEITIRPKDTWKETLSGWLGGILGKESYQTYVNKNVLAVNQWIKAFAGEEGIFLLDFQPALSNVKGVRKKEFATPDGSHISQKGYEKMTEYVNEKLGKRFKE